jgi:hypothetical protein
MKKILILILIIEILKSNSWIVISRCCENIDKTEYFKDHHKPWKIGEIPPSEIVCYKNIKDAIEADYPYKSLIGKIVLEKIIITTEEDNEIQDYHKKFPSTTDLEYYDVWKLVNTIQI